LVFYSGGPLLLFGLSYMLFSLNVWSIATILCGFCLSCLASPFIDSVSIGDSPILYSVLANKRVKYRSLYQGFLKNKTPFEGRWPWHLWRIQRQRHRRRLLMRHQWRFCRRLRLQTIGPSFRFLGIYVVSSSIRDDSTSISEVFLFN